MRVSDPPSGYRIVKERDEEGGTVFAPDNSQDHQQKQHRATRDWAADATRYARALTSEKLQSLASTLGVSPDSLTALGVGWRGRDNTFTFPEVDANGQVIGISRRYPDRTKKAIYGGHRGLTVPKAFENLPDPVLIVEGPTDAAACLSLQLTAVGRPSNRSARYLAGLLAGRDVISLGENDQKPDGSWPGRDGAIAVAKSLAKGWGTSVRCALPPKGSKDIREWLASKQLDPTDSEACRAARGVLLAAVEANAQVVEPPAKRQGSEETSRMSTADKLAALAEEHFCFGQTPADEAFAVAKHGPNIARMLRGGGGSLRSQLARMYRATFKKTPNSSALADTMLVLEGLALEADPETVHLRVAQHGCGVVLDLGTANGRAVLIEPKGWTILDHSAVLFRRTDLIGQLPDPVRGGDLDALRRLVNVTDEVWPLVVGWLVATLMPDLDHPIALLTGIEGTGKSTTARMLASVVDASPVGLRPPPTDLEGWALGASGSWIIPIDNVSTISPWWSDALCRTITGDGLVRRRLWSDNDLAVLSFRRCVLLTSIDAGALRGDLGSRLLMLDLESIPEDERQEEQDLYTAFSRLHPRILGGLCDLTSKILSVMPDVRPKKLPRLAGFGRLLAAVDRVLGTDAVARFSAHGARVVADVLESDPVAAEVQAFMARERVWKGTMGELLKEFTPEKPPRHWPADPRSLSGRLKRLIPALASWGIAVEPPVGLTGPRRRREWRIWLTETASDVSNVSVSTDASARVCDNDTNRSHDRSPRKPVDDGGNTDLSVASAESAESPASSGQALVPRVGYESGLI